MTRLFSDDRCLVVELADDGTGTVKTRPEPEQSWGPPVPVKPQGHQAQRCSCGHVIGDHRVVSNAVTVRAGLCFSCPCVQFTEACCPVLALPKWRPDMAAETLFRPRAFIPHGSDEGMFDTLGFWNHGTFKGEWSGTNSWLADMPLPTEHIVTGLIKDLKTMPRIVEAAREAAAAGALEPVVLLAPVQTKGGFVVLPIDGRPYDVNPNFVAHIERGIPGGEWMLATEPIARDAKEGDHPALIYVVDGEARGVIALIRQEEPDVD